MSDQPPFCVKHGQHEGMQCPKCLELDRARDIVRTTYIPPASRTSNPSGAPDVEYSITLMGCWARDETPCGPAGAAKLALASLEHLKGELGRLTRERNQLLAAIGEHVTVRSDQYAEIQRLTRERQANANEIQRLYGLVNHWYGERGRLRTALERCRLASGLAKAEIIDAALSGEPSPSETTGKSRSAYISDLTVRRLDSGYVVTWQEDGEPCGSETISEKLAYALVRADGGILGITDDSAVKAPETSERPAHPLDGYCPGKRYIRSKLFQQFLEQDFWHAHHVDLVWRYNGEDVHEEADWLKDVWYALRESEDREPIAEGDARYYQAHSSEKASVCMGCNSTPCVCAELGGAQEAPACRSCGHVPAPGQQLTASGNCLVCEAL